MLRNVPNKALIQKFYIEELEGQRSIQFSSGVTSSSPYIHIHVHGNIVNIVQVATRR